MVNNYSVDEEKTKFSWKNFSRMLKFIKPHKKELLIAFVIGIISSVLLLFIPKIFAYAIDVSFVNKDFMQILLLAFIILGLILVSIFLSKFQRNKMGIVLEKIANDIKMAIFEKLQYLPHSYYNTRSHGKIYTRATSYPNDVAAIFCYIIVDGILDIINLVFVLVFMFMINVKLSLISVILSIVLIIIFIVVSPFRRKYKHKVNDKVSNVNAYLSESINGIRITQSFNREKRNQGIIRDLELDVRKYYKKSQYLSNLTWSATGIFSYVTKILIYYIGFKYFYPIVTLGDIVAIDSYANNFWNPISYLTESYNELMDASTYLERIFELLDEPLIIEDSKNAKAINIKGKIEFRNVNFSYNISNPVLNNLNLTINEGEKIGFVGETGCGKSTILSLISRFYDVTAGEILIDDINIKDIRLDSLRGQIGEMLQDNFLFARTVYDNLVLDKKISKREVEDICKKLDIHDMIMKLENGYDTLLLNNGSILSNGEKQLICIARIMIQNPKILILDEATSNIDLKTEKKVTNALKILTKGRTTIMVAHRISTVKDCDKIILIKNHQNFEEGSHLQLMRKKGEYYNLYSAQAIF